MESSGAQVPAISIEADYECLMGCASLCHQSASYNSVQYPTLVSDSRLDPRTHRRTVQ
jgi:hypothetical protein